MAERKPKVALSAVKRTRRPVPNLEAPELERASVSEQKINQFRKRRYEAIHAGGEPKGRLGARARVDLLLDRDSFVELDLYARSRAAGFGMEDRRVPGDGHMFITGPEVVRVTTGEHVTFDQLGGAEVHGVRSGVAHFLPPNERDCYREVRRLLSYLPANSGEKPPYRPTTDDPERADPELQTIIPASPNLPYDMREVLIRILDNRELLAVQPFFAQNIVVGLGRLKGHVVGVVGNQPRVLAGAIDIDASVKAARFIRFCDAFNFPLLSFVDVPGSLPGTAQEYGGIIRHGAKLLYAYAEATVPKLTVITRKDYGGAYCVMASKQLGADLNLAWPSAEIAVMGPSAAVGIIFRRELAAAKDPDKRRKELVADYLERFANPYVAAERGYIDDVCEPRETRRLLVRALELCLNKRVEPPPRKHGNIPL